MGQAFAKKQVTEHCPSGFSWYVAVATFQDGPFSPYLHGCAAVTKTLKTRNSLGGATASPSVKLYKFYHLVADASFAG